jgi:hypothetical protein
MPFPDAPMQFLDLDSIPRCGTLAIHGHAHEWTVGRLLRAGHYATLKTKYTFFRQWISVHINEVPQRTVVVGLQQRNQISGCRAPTARIGQ